LTIAQFLEQHPKIFNVNYPGLVSNTHHLRAKDLLDGFGGMVSFELRGNVNDAEHFLKNVSLPIIAPSLGGVETLITRPVTTSHAGMSNDEREQRGITDTLIRISVGIEATEDLLEDFENALKNLS
jgi:cystathionine beta-lyase/cystathionine gamma-synthase